MLGLRTHSQMVFFDRSIIKTNWSRLSQNPANKAGLLIRKIARQSIRRGRPTKTGYRRPSRPGQPPKSWKPGVTPPMKMIYSYPHGPGAIVGFVGFGARDPVPAIHEHGLTVPRRVFRFTTKKGKRKKRPVMQMIQYPKRPVMLPALLRAMQYIPGMWRGALNRAA